MIEYYPPENKNAWLCPVFKFCMIILFIACVFVLTLWVVDTFLTSKAYPMDGETMNQARVLLEATPGIPDHQIEAVLNRLERFNTLEQADAYNRLMAKCERYYDKAQPANRKKFVARIEELQDINTIDGSLQVIVDHLGTRAPTEDEVRMAERYLGIPTWFERK